MGIELFLSIALVALVWLAWVVIKKVACFVKILFFILVAFMLIAYIVYLSITA